MDTNDSLIFNSSKIEFKSENGKFYTEGFLEVAGDTDIYGDVCTEHCIDSIVSQCNGKDIKAVMSSSGTSRAIKMSANHAHLNNQLGGDRRELPVGKIIESKKVSESGKSKAWIKTEVNSSHPEYKAIKSCIEDGYFDAYSIEFFPIPNETAKSGDKRILNDLKLTGAAYTGRPALHSAVMTNFTFEQFKSIMDDEFKKEFDKQRAEHPSFSDDQIRTIVHDHMSMRTKSEEKKSDIMETKIEEKKSEVVPSTPISEPVVEQAKSELLTKEQVKAMIEEQFKSHDLKTLEQTKSIMAEEIKKNAEELKSKVLIQDNGEQKKSEPKTFFDQLASDRGWKAK